MLFYSDNVVLLFACVEFLYIRIGSGPFPGNFGDLNDAKSERFHQNA